MSDQFDPYYTWLGIPPEEQPPDHYRLLGIRRFENNPEVISNALDQRMAHIRSFQTGKRGGQSQEVLTELSKAGGCLLNVEKKGSYDRELRQKDAPKLSKPTHAVLQAKPLSPNKSGPVNVVAPVSTTPSPTTHSSSHAPAGHDTLAASATPAEPLPVQIVIPQRLPPLAAAAAPRASGTGPVVKGSPEGLASRRPGIAGPRPAWQHPVVLAVIACGIVCIVGGMALAALWVGGRLLAGNSPPPKASSKVDPERPSPQPVRPGPPTPGHPTTGPKPRPPVDPPVSLGPPIAVVVDPPEGVGPGTPAAGGSSQQPSDLGFALKFGGMQHVEIENTRQIASWNQTNTAELWVRWAPRVNEQRFMGTLWRMPEKDLNGKPKPWDGWALGVRNTNGRSTVVHYLVPPGSGPRSTSIPLGEFPSDDRWHHIAYAHDKTGLDIFVDGKRKRHSGPTPPVAELSNLFLGAPKFDPINNQFNGDICAFRLSSIKRYSQDFAPPAKFEKDNDTVALLDFSKNTGATIRDLSGHGHHGKIAGAKWVAATTAPSEIAAKPGTAGQKQAKWRNESYNATLRHVKDKEWAEFDNDTGRLRLKYEEIARSAEYLELFCRERNYMVRFSASKQEQQKNGNWEWVANGRWVSSDGSAPPPTTVVDNSNTGKPFGAVGPPEVGLPVEPRPSIPSEDPPPLVVKKIDVPESGEQDKARGEVRSTLKQEFAKAVKPLEKSALADKLVLLAKEEKEPANRYVLFEEARSLKLEAGDVAGAFQIVDKMISTFEVNPWKAKTAALEKGSKVADTNEGRKRLVEMALKVGDAAVAAAEFEAAAEAAAVASSAAERVGDIKLKTPARNLKTSVEAGKKQFELAQQASQRLKTEPDNPKANLAWGKFLCLVKRDWKEGLPSLVKGDDEDLKAAAQLDLGEPVESEKQAALADAWWKLAQSATAREKYSLLLRAREWYQKSLPQASALKKLSAQKKIDEITAALPKETVAAAPKISGTWSGLVGRIRVDGRDAPLALKYEIDAPLQHERVVEQLAKFGIVGSNLRVELTGILHVPEAATIIVRQTAGAPVSGSFSDLRIDDRNIRDFAEPRVGPPNRGDDSVRISLAKGDYRLKWELQGRTLGGQLSFVNAETGEPLYVYNNRLSLQPYAALPTRGEMTFPK